MPSIWLYCKNKKEQELKTIHIGETTGNLKPYRSETERALTAIDIVMRCMGTAGDSVYRRVKVDFRCEVPFQSSSIQFAFLKSFVNTELYDRPTFTIRQTVPI